MNIRPGIKGHLKMTGIDKETNKEFILLDEQNAITYEGFSEMVKRMTYPTQHADINGSYFDHIVLGSDIGDGTLFQPTMATPELGAADQEIVYTIPREDIMINYISPTEFEFSTVLDGPLILDNYFPNEVDMRYTSATLRLQNGKVFSYKRFDVKSLSRLISIKIDWTIILSERFD